MKHYAGLDVSLKETSICIVDEMGSICRELKVPSHPEDLARALQDPTWRLVRIGPDAGPLSQWLFSGLAQAGLPMICIETRHTKAFLKAQENKTDRNDARGIAQMMRGCCHVNCCRAHYGRFGHRTGSSSDVGRRLPFRHGSEAVQMGGRGEAVGVGWNEKIANSREHADEPLQVPGRSKALHQPLASPERQMRVFRAIVEMGYSACRQSPSFQSEVWR